MRERSPFPGADFVKKVFGHFYTLGKRINTKPKLRSLTLWKVWFTLLSKKFILPAKKVEDHILYDAHIEFYFNDHILLLFI